jgi:hypothetical protein
VSLSPSFYDVIEHNGHRVPIPVQDVDERFREIPENDPFGMTGIIPGNTTVAG